MRAKTVRVCAYTRKRNGRLGLCNNALAFNATLAYKISFTQVEYVKPNFSAATARAPYLNMF